MSRFVLPGHLVASQTGCMADPAPQPTPSERLSSDLDPHQQAELRALAELLARAIIAKVDAELGSRRSVKSV